MESYRIALYLIFGVLPSLIWLFYYLRKDMHPEPKRMILEIFIFGSLMTIPVFLIQVSLADWLYQIKDLMFFIEHPTIVEIIKWFFIIALTEEVFKYLVVKLAVLRSRDLDEPMDIMIYMVVSALGFAAVENILYLISPVNTLTLSAVLQTTITISFIRFVGATFLHTLCSALIGYFIALSCIRRKNRISRAFLGIALATLLHGFYNFSIMTLPTPLNLQVPIITVVILAIVLVFAFNSVKKMKSVCKI